MARPAKVIGYAPIYETSNGLQVRRSEIRPANNRNYNGDSYDDDFGDDDDDDFGDDDDDFGDDEDVDFAGPRRDGRRERRGNRRDTRRANSDDRRGTRHRNQDRRESTREANRESRRGGGGSCKSENGSTKMAVKMLAGSNTASGSGVASTITIRPQYDLRAHDITFAGADTGAEISAIYFGSVPVWSESTPIPLSIFATTSMKNNNILEGAFIRGGLDITIHYVSGAAAQLKAIITGEEA